MFAGYLLIAVVCVAFSEAVDLSTITFPKRLHIFAQEAHKVDFSVIGTGCVVDGQSHAFGSVFTVAQTGPCIQFECKQSGLKLVSAESGCENVDHCKQNEFMLNHCTNHVCSLSDVVSGNSITVNRHLKAISEKKCYHKGVCHTLSEHFTVKFHSHIAICSCNNVDGIHCVM